MVHLTVAHRWGCSLLFKSGRVIGNEVELVLSSAATSGQAI